MTFPEPTITAVFNELRRQSRNGRVDGIDWNPLEEIAGPQAYRVFGILRDRGLMRDEVLPGCFGHTVHYLK